MATPRRLILVGISALCACGQTSSQPAPTGSATAAPKAAIAAPERPTLPTGGSGEAEPGPDVETAPPPATLPLQPPPPPPTTPPQNPSKEFERQTRDPAWAGPTETEIKKRVQVLGAHLDAAECRQDRCLIALRGSEQEMAGVLAKLETPEGLQGFAQSVYLTAPVDQGGTLVLRAYATFDR